MQDIFADFMTKMDGKFYCKTCGFVEKHTSNMRAHIESKHYSPGYNCPHCGRIFKISNTLRRHLKLQKCLVAGTTVVPSVDQFNP